MIGHAYLLVANRNKATIFELEDAANSMSKVETLENPTIRKYQLNV
ncbi:hypothetical protein [Lacimicrobium alkaliphilum]|uniref:Uncharacterized protein n=1 Tax=Lacimicrobium alkaliphilum TaxID=1526571 RepID=A0ABQ1R7A7_9ALTE|nr:hypothetical protein [Lacimicrobium alkaliphilum]GGD60991.1 hypothetical protein GCM10011357_15340 [Lacimicrobium alkaliphilum]